MLEQILRKMAFYLTGLELEQSILSEKKNQFLESFMEKLMQKLTGVTEVEDLDNVLEDLQNEQNEKQPTTVSA